MDDFFSKLLEGVSNRFIITALLGFIAYFNISEEYVSLRNIINAMSSVILIAGLFEVYLQKMYISTLSQNIINGFFSKKESLDLIKKEDIINSMNNMMNYLANDLHNDLQNKFSNRVSTHFIDVFKDDNCEHLHTFYSRYSLNIIIKKRGRNVNYINTHYKLTYTLVNNSNNEIAHNIFKKRGVEKTFFDAHPDILELKNLEIKVDNSPTQIIDVNEFTLKEVPIPDKVSINNREQITCATLYKDDKPYEVKFKDKLVIKKNIVIKTSINDIIYKCHFNRLATNIDITLSDEGAKKIHILNGFAFISKENIDITDVLDNNKNIKVNDLVFPRDDISFISER